MLFSIEINLLFEGGLNRPHFYFSLESHPNGTYPIALKGRACALASLLD
jgi:hypothetical protein